MRRALLALFLLLLPVAAESATSTPGQTCTVTLSNPNNDAPTADDVIRITSTGHTNGSNILVAAIPTPASDCGGDDLWVFWSGGAVRAGYVCDTSAGAPYFLLEGGGKITTNANSTLYCDVPDTATEVGTNPALRLGSNISGGSFQCNGICKFHGQQVVKTATSATNLSQTPAATDFLTLPPKIVPCPDANDEPNCSTASATIRLIYEGLSQQTGDPSDQGWDAMLTEIQPGDEIVFFDPYEPDVWAPVDEGFHYRVTAVSGTTTHKIDVSVDQGTVNGAGYPLARRRIKSFNLAANAAMGSDYVCVTAGDAGIDEAHAKAGMYLQWLSKVTSATSYLDDACDGTGDGKLCAMSSGRVRVSDTVLDAVDTICSAGQNRLQLMTPLPVSLTTSDTAFLTYGWRPGDAFKVIRPFRVTFASADNSNNQMTFNNSADLRNLRIENPQKFEVDSATTTRTSELHGIWILDSTGSAGFVLADHNINASDLSVTGSDPALSLSRHGVQADTSEEFTLAIGSYYQRTLNIDGLYLRHRADDGVTAQWSGTLAISKMRDQFASTYIASGTRGTCCGGGTCESCSMQMVENLIGTGGQLVTHANSQTTTLTDAECVHCNVDTDALTYDVDSIKRLGVVAYTGALDFGQNGSNAVLGKCADVEDLWAFGYSSATALYPPNVTRGFLADSTIANGLTGNDSYVLMRNTTLTNTQGTMLVYVSAGDVSGTHRSFNQDAFIDVDLTGSNGAVLRHNQSMVTLNVTAAVTNVVAAWTDEGIQKGYGAQRIFNPASDTAQRLSVDGLLVLNFDSKANGPAFASSLVTGVNWGTTCYANLPDGFASTSAIENAFPASTYRLMHPGVIDGFGGNFSILKSFIYLAGKSCGTTQAVGITSPNRTTVWSGLNLAASRMFIDPTSAGGAASRAGGTSGPGAPVPSH
jgi:hypothetical protein